MRGLGSLNFASKTLRAEARLACSGSLARGSARELDGPGRALASRAGAARSGSRAGAAGVLSIRSSLRISSGCEISGSLSRVRTGSGSAGASPLPCSSSGSPPGSARARRWASSFAFSAFLSASSSRLMSGRRLVERSERGRDAGWIGLQEEILSRHLITEAPKIAFHARIANHRGAKKNDQLGFPAELCAVGENIADERNAADTWNARVSVFRDVLHQSSKNAYLAALQAQNRIELACLKNRNGVRNGVRIGGGGLQGRIGIRHRVNPPANRWPDVQHHGIAFIDLRQHRHHEALSGNVRRCGERGLNGGAPSACRDGDRLRGRRDGEVNDVARHPQDRGLIVHHAELRAGQDFHVPELLEQLESGIEAATARDKADEGQQG